MSLDLWLAFSAAAFIVLIVPGPTILLVTGHALSHGRGAALGSVIGVVAGDALAVSLSLAGVGAILQTSATAFTVLKWIGAAYLIYLGIKLWRAPVHAIETEPLDFRPKRLAREAFVVTALNPKSIAFFIAFMPQFIRTDQPMLPQCVILGTTFCVLGGLNAAVYALAAGRFRSLLQGERALKVVHKLGGSFLIGAGVLTASMRRA